ncbi:MAG: hypothetical protein QGG73_10230 [Candidatus Hydrogenedentes bacterium]|nr:hypothetical protein [Candidatus Hydrogenedentota bacterium]
MNAIDDKLDGFLSPLDDRQRTAFAYVFRTWRDGGGSFADVGKAIALQTPWEGRNLTVLWAYGPGGQNLLPRFEAPLAALARSGIPTELIEAWRDDLTTVSGVGATVEGPNATATISEGFSDLDARKLVESALKLSNRI